MKSKTLSLIPAAGLIVLLLVAAVFVGTVAAATAITDPSQFKDNVIGDVSVSGKTVMLNSDCTLKSELSIQCELILDLNGKTLTAATQNRLFSVETANGNFTLKDSSGTGNGKLTGGRVASNGGGVYVTDEGMFTLSSGCITNCSLTAETHYGGGVYINGGRFIMSGGCITNCSLTEISCKGGGVFIEKGTFTMSGGSITDCSIITSGYGGGVVVKDGAFTMSGSSSIANCNANTGGGIYIDQKGKFIFESGSISGCSAINGGGVYGGSGTFSMKGGTIINCKATSTKTTGGGGGVMKAEFCKFDLVGGSITGCSALNGGGIYISGSGFNVSGVAQASGNTRNDGKVANNVYLSTKAGGALPLITINGELQSGACFGITTAVAPTKDTPVRFVTNGKEEYVPYFISDTPLSSHVDWDGTNIVLVNGSGTQYSITCDPAPHGSVTASPTCAPSTSLITITTIPDPGYLTHQTTPRNTNEQTSHEIPGNTFTLPAHDVIITATFAPNITTLLLDPNGGTNGTTAVTIAHNKHTFNTTIKKPTNPEHKLAGWNSSGGEQILTAGGKLLKNTTYTDAYGNWNSASLPHRAQLTLTAHWTNETTTLSLIINDDDTTNRQNLYGDEDNGYYAYANEQISIPLALIGNSTYPYLGAYDILLNVTINKSGTITGIKLEKTAVNNLLKNWIGHKNTTENNAALVYTIAGNNSAVPLNKTSAKTTILNITLNQSSEGNEYKLYVKPNNLTSANKGTLTMFSALTGTTDGTMQIDDFDSLLFNAANKENLVATILIKELEKLTGFTLPAYSQTFYTGGRNISLFWERENATNATNATIIGHTDKEIIGINNITWTFTGSIKGNLTNGTTTILDTEIQTSIITTGTAAPQSP